MNLAVLAHGNGLLAALYGAYHFFAFNHDCALRC